MTEITQTLQEAFQPVLVMILSALGVWAATGIRELKNRLLDRAEKEIEARTNRVVAENFREAFNELHDIARTRLHARLVEQNPDNPKEGVKSLTQDILRDVVREVTTHLAPQTTAIVAGSQPVSTVTDALLSKMTVERRRLIALARKDEDGDADVKQLDLELGLSGPKVF